MLLTSSPVLPLWLPATTKQTVRLATDTLFLMIEPNHYDEIPSFIAYFSLESFWDEVWRDFREKDIEFLTLKKQRETRKDVVDDSLSSFSKSIAQSQNWFEI